MGVLRPPPPISVLSGRNPAPSIYADARYNDAVLVSKAGLLGTDWTSLPQHFKQHGYWTVGSGTVLLQLTLRIKV